MSPISLLSIFLDLAGLFLVVWFLVRLISWLVIVIVSKGKKVRMEFFSPNRTKIFIAVILAVVGLIWRYFSHPLALCIPSLEPLTGLEKYSLYWSPGCGSVTMLDLISEYFVSFIPSLIISYLFLSFVQSLSLTSKKSTE